MSLTTEQLLNEANRWAAQAEAHRRAADFCDTQQLRFLAELAVTDEYKPKLELVWNAHEQDT